MFLDTVRPKDVPRGPTRYAKEDSQSLRTHDIPGAIPEYPHRRFHVDGPPEKEHINGTVAKTLYPDLHRPIDLSLTNRDIHKAQPSGEKFKTRRRVDPLTPRYDLPSFQERPVTPPGILIHEGQVRDSMEFKGTHKPRILERNYARNPNDGSDIEGSRTGDRRNRLGNATPRDMWKTVEKAGERILSSKCHSARSSHPLDPEYDMPSTTTHPFHRTEVESARAPRRAGRVEGATPRQLHRDNGEPQASLIRRDLPGAVPQRFKGTMPFSIYDPPEVTPHARHLGLDCSDIEGTQTGTRKAGAWAALGTR